MLSLVEKGLQDLLERLDGLPLALAGAGSYLCQTPDSIEDYLNQYNESWMELQQYTPSLPEQEGRTLCVTWQITANRIKQKDPLVWQILELWTFFDNSGVWYDLLQSGEESAPQCFQTLTSTKLVFTRYMRMLCDYGLVDIERNPAGYGIHNCFHDWLRATLPMDTKQTLSDLALSCLARSAPFKETGRSWSRRVKLLAHIDAYSVHFTFQAKRLAQHQNLCDIAAFYVSIRRLEDAESLYLMIIHNRENLIGPLDIELFDLKYRLGCVYWHWGKIIQAESITKTVLEDQMQVLGNENDETLRTLNLLATIYCAQEKWTEAESMYSRVYEGKLKTSGPQHHDTLEALNNLGSIYEDQQRLNEAKAMYLRSLEGQENLPCIEHSGMLRALRNLTCVCKKLENLADAEKWYLRMLRRQRHLPESKKTVVLQGAIANDLGMLYTDVFRFDEAEKILADTLKICEANLDLDDNVILCIIDSLGCLYLQRDDLAMAEALFLRSLEGSKRTIGPHHPGTLETMQNLGDVYLGQKRFDEAETTFRQAYDGLKKWFGDEDPRSRSAFQRLADVQIHRVP